MRKKVNRWPYMLVGLLTIVAGVAGAGYKAGGGRASASKGGDVPVGWASVEGGTRGGLGGARVTVSDADSFVKQAQRQEALILHVSGTIRLSGTVRVQSNKTILGLGAKAAITGGGLNLRGVSNVIIRNIAFSNAEDAINVERGSHHIWIDHCDLSNCRDGLIDIKQGSDFVTVSWNRFHDHQKTCLLGHSDSATARRLDQGHLRVTYHHNFFDASKTRHPRVRLGEPVHVFNNYYRNNDYGVASTSDAGVVVEGNYFENVRQPTYTQYGDSKEPGRLVERKNRFVKSGAPQTRGTVKEPGGSYRYALDDAAKIPAIVKEGAGVGKIIHREGT
jgi:pectate lyase